MSENPIIAESGANPAFPVLEEPWPGEASGSVAGSRFLRKTPVIAESGAHPGIRDF